MNYTHSLIKVNSFDYSKTPVSLDRPTFHYKLKEYLYPLISIVTPFYNTGIIFWETVQSVLQQSLQQFEWIIVNDGSNSPDSIEILNQIRSIDGRVRVIDHSSNLGLPAARNTGISESRTSFILLLDSDDLLEPTSSEKWYWFLKANPQYSFVKGYTVGFGANSYLWARGFHQKELFLQENIVEVTSLIRKDVLDYIGGFDESLRNGFEDWDLWLKCANAGFWGATIPEYQSWYRRSENSLQRWQAFEQPKKFIKISRKKYRNLNRRYLSSLPKKHLETQSFPDVEANLLTKTKPRLLMIIPWLNWGGADKFNLDLVRLLHQHGWEITIVTTLISDDPWWQEFMNITPDIFMLHRFLPIKAYPDFLTYLIRSRDPDIVLLSNSEIGYMLLPYLRLLCPKPLYLDYCHMEEEDWNEGGYPRYSLKYQDFLDLTLLASDHLRNWMIERGGGFDRLQTCYINVDTNLWRPNNTVRKQMRYEIGVNEDVPIILYAARFCEQKQPLVFAQAIKKLAEQGNEFLALAVGDGPDKEALVNYIRKNKLENRIRIMEAVEPEKMRKIFQAADIFFLPSKMEGIALSIYEAMSCGLAVVGADVGGQAELVVKDCGILIKPSGDIQEDIKVYSQILSELVSNKEIRESLGRNARLRVVENFDHTKMINRILYLFDYAGKLRNKTPKSDNYWEDPLQIVKKVIDDYSSRTITSVEKLNKFWKPPSFKVQIYYWLRSHLFSLYHVMKRRGWKWIPKLKNRLVKFLTSNSLEEP